jgi:hypothetical protein
MVGWLVALRELTGELSCATCRARAAVPAEEAGVVARLAFVRDFLDHHRGCEGSH